MKKKKEEALTANCMQKDLALCGGVEQAVQSTAVLQSEQTKQSSSNANYPA